MITMISVQSSNISAIGYDENQNILIIQFNDGSIYHYFNIKKELYNELLLADSKGRYFYKNIKSQGYSYNKV